jgi:hypothetical protein
MHVWTLIDCLPWSVFPWWSSAVFTPALVRQFHRANPSLTTNRSNRRTLGPKAAHAQDLQRPINTCFTGIAQIGKPYSAPIASVSASTLATFLKRAGPAGEDRCWFFTWFSEFSGRFRFGFWWFITPGYLLLLDRTTWRRRTRQNPCGGLLANKK